MKKLMSPQVMRTELRQALARLDVPDQHLDVAQWRAIVVALQKVANAAAKHCDASEREAAKP